MREGAMGDQYHQVRLTDSAYGHGGAQGLAAAAHEAAGAGRGGDSFLVHVNAKELAEMQQRWGEPTINPHTGMPEFFLGGLRDWFKENPWASVALPVATSMLLPGLGTAVGGAVNSGLGLGLESTGAASLGQGLVGGGLGYLTGGGKGALIGGALGAAMPWVQNGALGSGLQTLTGGHPDTNDGGFNNEAARASMGQPAQQSSGALGSIFGGGGSGGGGSSLGSMLPLLAVAGAMGGMGGGSKSSSSSPVINGDQQQVINGQNQHLSQVPLNRKFTPPKGDLTQYGYGSEQPMFSGNHLARGGQPHGALAMASQEPSRYVAGPGTGRDDKIPAKLSDGEYVMDAETTSMLGDGSSDAGAAALDKLRENVRKHKGKALAKGKFSPNAKDPVKYLPKGVM